jgi:hypothetical protein
MSAVGGCFVRMSNNIVNVLISYSLLLFVANAATTKLTGDSSEYVVSLSSSMLLHT